MKSNNKDDLRQRLLELHYDLLEDDEAQQLRDAIATDPDVASQWAATLRMAGKFADAAKFENGDVTKVNLGRWVNEKASTNGSTSPDDHPIVARVMESVSPNERQASDKITAPDDAQVTPARSWRWLASISGLAATAAAIGMLVIGSWYAESIPVRPTSVIAVRAQAVPSHTAQSENEFQFVTSLLDGSSSPVGGFRVTPAMLSFSVLAHSTTLFSGTTQTGSDGAGRISLPAELVIPKEAKLRVTAKSLDGQMSGSTIDVPLEPTRCLTYVTVDRPVYRPGETVYFRSLTLQRRSLQANSDVPIRFELVDPSGAVVPGAFTEGVTERGVGNGSFAIPSAAPGGPYALVAKSLDGFFPDERCEIQVRSYRVPRFKKELEFRKRSYGPGESVEADFSAVRAEGGPLANAKIRVTATVDDQVVHQSTTTNSPAGSCFISFRLPALINKGAGQLSVVIDDGGTRETMSKTIPIQLGHAAVDFYPEGGYLVDGLKNRVYFSARDSLGNPIHIAGEVLSRSGKSVAQIETKRDGMGRFEFVPEKGQRYTLKISTPVDVTNSPKLPAVVQNLPVIDTGSGVIESTQPIMMEVRSVTAMPAIIRAVCRGQLIGEQSVQLRPGENSFSLPVHDEVGGVIRLTILDPETVPAQPLVERLVYRRHDKQLQVEIADQSSLERSPGEPLRLTLQVRDETGEPAPAVLGVSVVDDAALSLQQTERPRLRTHFLLTSEVQKPEDLEHANFYLSDEPDAAESLDLLLGTQGWRRFVSGSSSQPNDDFREQLIRLLELNGSDSSTASTRIDNFNRFQDRWSGYHESVRTAWRRLVVEARILMFFVLLLWLMSILVHMRRLARVKVAVWLLIASTSAFICGCGASQEGIVVQSVAPAASDVDDAQMYAASGSSSDTAQSESVPRVALSDPAAEPQDQLAQSRYVNHEGDAQRFRNRDPSATGSSTTLNVPSREHSISKQDLKRLLAARGLNAEALADQFLDELRFPVREYAHQHESNDNAVRDDFSETLYWQPLLITDSEGQATIRFDLSDSVTTFRVNVDGHSSDGRIGSGGGEITARLPFQIEPKLPLEVTMGDRIDLPIAVINTTPEVSEVNVSVITDPSLQPKGDTTRVVKLGGKERRREYLSLDVVAGSAEQDATIEIRGSGTGSLADSIRRSVHIAPAGYPTRGSMAGRLSDQTKVRLPIPDDIVPGSLAVTVRAYPSPLADVMSGVESILREPHGCFEQTSATNYPNAMALLYLKESQTANPEVSRRALGMLNRGYQKLISFECENLGYEWFGTDPGHEALSAFGLMQFTDMSRVMTVKEEVLTRTRNWLMGRRDGQGGFRRNPRHSHVWSVRQPIVNAYVLWSLTEADVAAGQPHRATSELAMELDQLNRVARDSSDPYLVALSAATLMNVRRTDDGEFLLQKLAGMQKEDGSLQGTTTVVSSGGLSLKMETTALAALAWIKSPQYVSQAQAAAKWIASNRLGTAGFGSTQATVLALKALIAISGHSQTKVGGELLVQLDGKVIGQARLPQRLGSESTVEISGLGAKLETLGENLGDVEIELVASQSNNLSYTIDVACHVTKPNSDDSCPIKLTVEFADDDRIAAGETLKVETRVSNQSSDGQPMTVAIVGLPGGLEPRAEELDQLQQQGRFDYYEIRGREVVLYWRTVEPDAVKAVDFHVTAAIPGKYTGAASRAYLYYTAEQKQWTLPLMVEIKP